MELVGALAADEKTKQVLSKFKHNLLIIHIQHLASASGASFTEYGWSKIHKNVTPLPGEKLIIKITRTV
jgi:hypothetical protein